MSELLGIGIIPNMQSDYVGGIHTACDMRAEPWVAVPALSGIAARAGTILVENCAVRTLDMSAGRMAGVFTEAGLIKIPEVVLAGGAWSSLFLRNMGAALPQLSVRATFAATGPLPVVQMGGVAGKNLAFRPRADGGYSLASGRLSELFVGPDAWSTPRHWAENQESSFEATRVLNPDPNSNPREVRDLCKRFESMFPILVLRLVEF